MVSGGWVWVVVVALRCGPQTRPGVSPGKVRDRRLLENCTVDASIFVKHEACLLVAHVVAVRCVTVVSAILLLS